MYTYTHDIHFMYSKKTMFLHICWCPDGFCQEASLAGSETLAVALCSGAAAEASQPRAGHGWDNVKPPKTTSPTTYQKWVVYKMRI